MMSIRDSTGAFLPGLYVLDLGTDTYTRLEDFDNMLPVGARWISWSPEGHRLLMWTRSAISIFDLRDWSWTTVFPDGWYAVDPQWCPGGDSVCYVSYGGLTFHNLRTGTASVFRTADSTMILPVAPVSFSPDGRAMTFAQHVDDPGIPFPLSAYVTEIFVVGLDGRGLRQVTRLKGVAANPQWLPRGNEIVFDFVPVECLFSKPVRHTWSVRPDGTGLRRWRVDLGDSRVQFGWPPSIDRTGTQVAYIGVDPADTLGTVYVMNLDGTGRRKVLPGTVKWPESGE
jgi:Tol biopolymer transport system component